MTAHVSSDFGSDADEVNIAAGVQYAVRAIQAPSSGRATIHSVAASLHFGGGFTSLWGCQLRILRASPVGPGQAVAGWTDEYVEPYLAQPTKPLETLFSTWVISNDQYREYRFSDGEIDATNGGVLYVVAGQAYTQILGLALSGRIFLTVNGAYSFDSFSRNSEQQSHIRLR